MAKTSKSSTPKGVRPYELRISRLTIDKLGVKLYDKVSAVVAELIANGYDADAENVDVRLPLNSALATKKKDGSVAEYGLVIEVEDDGHGMTPDEAIDYYLEVGKDRRDDKKQGAYSRAKKRPVMGRKGIGKLAPFGICKRIEVISAGGVRTKDGYIVANFYLDYDRIVKDDDKKVELERGVLDRTFRDQPGTTIRLSNFWPKRVPDVETFHRQVASRFIFAQPDFNIFVEDSKNPTANPQRQVAPLDVATVDNTKINLDTRPVTAEDGETLPVKGWLAMAKESYKNEEMAGVRIYARNKIVATTRDFEQPAGFTGEFTVRSYLVGEVYAEWLDLDDGEDLIRSDRQGILWDSEYGRALRNWGASLIKEIGAITKEPRRKKARDLFLSKSDFAVKAKARFPDKEVYEVALELAGQIGAFAAEDELEDEDYVEGLAEVILSVAPHKALIEAFQRFNEEIAGGEKASLDHLLALFGKARIAEMASYSQLAAERVKVLHELEGIVLTEADEAKLQELIQEAPWLIEPKWTLITKNQTLKTFKTGFEAFYKKRTGESVVLALGNEVKKPDFILVSVGERLHIVEIKAPGHKFDDKDMDRLANYIESFDEFFESNVAFKNEFPLGYQIDLVADGVNLKKPANKQAFNAALKGAKVRRASWLDFLTLAKKSHELFLAISDKFTAVKDALSKK
jgi:histidine kinase/DNA gyrase B/HSP90-like ATPase